MSNQKVRNDQKWFEMEYTRANKRPNLKNTIVKEKLLTLNLKSLSDILFFALG